MWSKVKQVREAHRWVCPDPRLRGLNVVAGPFRPYPPTEAITWEQSQPQRFRARAREGGERRGLAHVTCLEVEALMKGTEDGDLNFAARRAAYGPSSDPEPDYMSLMSKMTASFPTLGD